MINEDYLLRVTYGENNREIAIAMKKYNLKDITDILDKLSYVTNFSFSKKDYKRETITKKEDYNIGTQKLIDDFHILYFNRVKGCSWLGEPCQKYPSDLMNYQELIFELKPDVIIETGTNQGGTAFFFRTILDLIGKPDAKVITCDIQDIRTNRIRNLERIYFVCGSSTDKSTFNLIKAEIKPTDVVLVVLDSNHYESHVIKEIELYSTLVTKGSYMIVEDSDLNGHPIEPNYGRGPYEAIETFMKDNKEFIFDKERENKYVIVCAINGYLKKL